MREHKTSGLEFNSIFFRKYCILKILYVFPGSTEGKRPDFHITFGTQSLNQRYSYAVHKYIVSK